MVIRLGKYRGHPVVGVQVSVVDIPVAGHQLFIVQKGVNRNSAHDLLRDADKVPLLLLIPVEMHQGLRRLPPLSLAHHRAEQAYGLLHQRIGNAGQGRVETRPDLIQHGDVFSGGDKLPRACNTALIDLSIPPGDKGDGFRRGLGLRQIQKSALICTGISLFLHTD